MRTLLISANTEQLQMPVLPMGLACVAAAAEHAGHEVRLLNLMTKEDFQELKLENAISGFNPELVGVSVRNIDDQYMKSPKFLLDAVRNVVTSCRSLTSAPIVLGGAGYSIYPRSASRLSWSRHGDKGRGGSRFCEAVGRTFPKRGPVGRSQPGFGLTLPVKIRPRSSKGSTTPRCPFPTACFRFPPNSKIRKSGFPSRPAGAARWNAVTVRLQP